MRKPTLSELSRGKLINVRQKRKVAAVNSTDDEWIRIRAAAKLERKYLGVFMGDILIVAANEILKKHGYE